MSFPERIDRVVMTGFMASGKSTVGSALARRLDWGFVDFDVEIERREGRPVARIIEDDGEPYFRGLEARLTEEFGGELCLVLAPGGGWITNPHLLDSIRHGTLCVCLQASVDEIARRIRADSADHPFKDHPDPAEPISRMLAERAPLYARADAKISVDGRPVEAIASEIEQIVRSAGTGCR